MQRRAPEGGETTRGQRRTLPHASPQQRYALTYVKSRTRAAPSSRQDSQSRVPAKLTVDYERASAEMERVGASMWAGRWRVHVFCPRRSGRALPASGARARRIGSQQRRCLASQVVCREERPVVSPLQWPAGGGVRQRNAPLPTVCNCNRSIVANGLYRHSPDHHSTRPSTSARLPYATLRKSSRPRVGYGSAVGHRSPSFLFAYGKSQHLI